MRARNMQVLTDDIKKENPGVVIYGKGDKSHQSRISDHNEDDTPGSKAAQSDADNVPEHRAIDVMLGPAMSRAQMYIIINRILNDPRLRARLRYINFENWQWSESNGWVPVDNSDDPHPGHGHFSGKAANDEDASPWFTSNGKDEMIAIRGMGQGINPPKEEVAIVKKLQRKLAYVVEGDPRLETHSLVVDGNFGGNTAFWVSVQLTGGEGNTVNDFWFDTLDEMYTEKLVNARVAAALAAHLGNTPHGGQLPETLTFIIPAQSITASINSAS